LRIAYLINQYPAISHSFIRREILALEKLGFDVMRISLRGWDLELVDKEDFAERERTRYVLRTGALALLLAVVRMLLKRPIRVARALGMACQMSRGSNRPLTVHLAYLAEACSIEPWLREANVMHVHAHFGTNSAEVAMLAHILGGPRWSFTIHGPEEFEAVIPLHLVEKIARSCFAVSISSYGRSQLCRAINYNDWQKIHVVHCGLDPVFRIAPATSGVLPRRVVCVARLSPAKGHEILLEAARELATKGIDFQLILAGDGQLRSEIEARISQYNLTDRVKITGWLSGEQVRNEILASRALVLASYAEGLPVVIMEAMALRRPVIATYIAGIPELVRPGEDGWLVPASDKEALIEALRNCLEAPDELLKRMGESARERVLTRHDVNTEATKLQKLFQAEISEQHGPSYSGRAIR
jgi:glycosyltransferase involved in cell wall biosynthesis